MSIAAEMQVVTRNQIVWAMTTFELQKQLDAAIQHIQAFGGRVTRISHVPQSGLWTATVTYQKRVRSE